MCDASENNRDTPHYTPMYHQNDFKSVILRYRKLYIMSLLRVFNFCTSHWQKKKMKKMTEKMTHDKNDTCRTRYSI